MPPAVGIGAGLGLSAIGGAVGSITSANAARRARRGAQAQFDFAQQFRPNYFVPSAAQQSALYQALLSQAGPGVENQARNQLTQDFNTQRERGRQQVVESSARRGLFRSGIGAQQEAQFLTEQDQNLQRALLEQQLGFQQQRAQALNQAMAFQNAQLAGQGGVYNSLLGVAGQGAQVAGQQTAAANQALSNAIQGPASFLTNYGLLRSFY